jgi:hypothetical protein
MRNPLMLAMKIPTTPPNSVGTCGMEFPVHYEVVEPRSLQPEVTVYPENVVDGTLNSTNVAVFHEERIYISLTV